MRVRAAAVGLVALVAAVVLTGHATAAGGTPVVPSLDPAGTAKLWKQLVERPGRAHLNAQAACRPLRGVFYAQTDWLRLATRLVAQASPCAQYYVSVPPLAASKTTLRNGEAAKIRALGTNVHALAEINWTGWKAWVTQNSSTWFEAGVEARRADGNGRLRRLQGRHVGGQRVPLLGPSRPAPTARTPGSSSAAYTRARAARRRRASSGSSASARRWRTRRPTRRTCRTGSATPVSGPTWAPTSPTGRRRCTATTGKPPCPGRHRSSGVTT